MTREEIAQYIKSELANDDTEIYLDIDDYKIIVKALEQEPILDKIRAEIENDWQLKKSPCGPFSCGLRQAIKIIDKYKAESEDKENNE